MPADQVLREEDGRDAVQAVRGEGDALLIELGPEEAIGDADENARPVAAIRLTAAPATVIHPLQHLQRVGDNGVRRLPLDMAHEPDATGVVLELRVIQPLGGRKTDVVSCGAHNG